DLSAFSQAGGVAEGEYTVSVFVNQQDVGQFTLNFIKNAHGEIAPELTPEQLDTFGVNVSQIPVLKDLPNGEFISDLGALIPQATTRLDLSRLRLNISVPQVAMQSQVNRNADPSLWDDGIPALMANYNVSAGRTTSRYDHGKKNQNTNVFASARLGANAGPWRLRSNLTHSRFEYSGSENQSATTNTQT
ncbi:TPA: FimD/PapC N-terminal domain-containing protein, partial [Providencia alcalifaciens]